MRTLFSAVGLAVTLALPAAAQRPQEHVAIPRDTVVQVRLLQNLSSKTAHVGDRVRVRVADADQSGLPPDAVLVGRVTQVRRANRSRPGVIDIDFGAVELGNGWRPISGDLYSLSDKDVRQNASGRLVAKKRSSDKLKFIGYGAAGGVLLGKLLGTSSIKGALLGAAAGYLYGQTRKDNYRDVELDDGTKFGVRLNRRLVLG